jgi:hypothetical protein
MSERIGRYTYKNNTVLREFLGRLARALGKRSGKKAIAQLKKDPEMKKLVTKMDKDAEKIMTRAQKERKNNPGLDKYLKSVGL